MNKKGKEKGVMSVEPYYGAPISQNKGNERSDRRRERRKKSRMRSIRKGSKKLSYICMSGGRELIENERIDDGDDQ